MTIPVDAVKKVSVNLGGPDYDSSLNQNSNRKIKRSQQPSQPSYEDVMNERKERARKSIESLNADREQIIRQHNARLSKGGMSKDTRKAVKESYYRNLNNVNDLIDRNLLRSKGEFDQAERLEARQSYNADRKWKREKYKEDRARKNLPEDPNKVRYTDPKSGRTSDIDIKDFNSPDQYWTPEGRVSFLRQAKKQGFKVDGKVPNIPRGKTIHLNGNHTYENVIVKNGGVILVDGILNLTAIQSIQVLNNSMINADKGGYAGGMSSAYCCGQRGKGPGGGGGGQGNTGAGSGGIFVEVDDIQIGSGGGGGNGIPGYIKFPAGKGGRGGGGIMLTANSIIIQGKISVNGEDGVSGNTMKVSGGGGGSGGEIIIKSILLNYSNSVIHSKGGRGGKSGGSRGFGGSNGGFGKIKFLYSIIFNSSASVDGHIEFETLPDMINIKIKNKFDENIFYNFVANFSNGTFNRVMMSEKKLLYFKPSDIGHGEYNVHIYGNGFNNINKKIYMDPLQNIIVTYNVLPASLTINGVYDEQTLEKICYNLQLFNGTSSINSSSCGPISFGYEAIPQGLVKATIKNDDYIQRTYYVTVNSKNYISLTGWLLKSGSGSYINFLVSSETGGEKDVLTSALRFLNGSWVVVDQRMTDSQGKGFFYLFPWVSHKINSMKGNQKASIDSYYPSATSTLNIKLESSRKEKSSESFEWMFDTVAVSIDPTSSYLKKNTMLSYKVVAEKSDLTYWGVRLFRIDGRNIISLYNKTVMGSPSGGEIKINLDTKTEADRWDLVVFFKRSSYDEWNHTQKYFSETNVGTGYFPNFLESLTKTGSGGLGIKNEGTIYFIAIFIAVLVGAGCSRINFGGEGSGLMLGAMGFIIVLGFFAAINFIDWVFVLAMLLMAIGINLARRFA